MDSSIAISLYGVVCSYAVTNCVRGFFSFGCPCSVFGFQFPRFFSGFGLRFSVFSFRFPVRCYVATITRFQDRRLALALLNQLISLKSKDSLGNYWKNIKYYLVWKIALGLCYQSDSCVCMLFDNWSNADNLEFSRPKQRACIFLWPLDQNNIATSYRFYLTSS